MNCPRCRATTHAERTYCPACDWELARPFSSDPVIPPAGGNGRGNGNGFSPARAPIHIAPDSFSLTPPVMADWAKRPQQRHKFSRRHRHGPPTGREAVAVLPAEARWEAPPRFEVVEMPVVQSSFDFTAAEQEAQRLAAQAAAPVGVRFQAAWFDATLIVLAAGLFFGLFALLGGHIGFTRRDLLIYLVAGYSLAMLYFGLFTLLGGRTPGMQYYHLRVVNFEGQPLTRAQSLWRAFGYVVSSGSLLVGFLWAAADERRLTWHDHISQTFITDRTVL